MCREYKPTTLFLIMQVFLQIYLIVNLRSYLQNRNYRDDANYMIAAKGEEK